MNLDHQLVPLRLGSTSGTTSGTTSTVYQHAKATACMTLGTDGNA